MSADRRALLRRAAFLLLLIALAVERRGAPSPATLIGIAAAVALGVGIRLIGVRARRLPPELRPWLLASVLLALAGGLTKLLGDERPFSAPWITLVALPLAIWLGTPGSTLVPRVRWLAGCFLGSLALGVLATEPWESTAGRSLLAALALLGVVAAILDTGRAILPPTLPAPSVSSRRRAAATALLLSLLILATAIGVDAALAPVPRLWKPPPPAARTDDRLANEMRAEQGLPESKRADEALALVRIVDSDVEPDRIPARLYLRTKCFEALADDAELVHFGPREGPSEVHRDVDDGAEDLRIHWPESRDGERRRALVFQVTLLDETLDALPIIPVPRWIEGKVLEIAADGTIARPRGSGSFSYRTAGSPRAAFETQRLGERVAARAPPLTALPETFEGRGELEEFLAQLLVGQPDDLARARAIATHLSSTGRLDPSAPFEGWGRFLAMRAGSSPHFAQCFVLLARLAKLPARVAMGFATGEYDEKDRRFEVRARHLHYWGEVQLEELGWVDFDPCPDESATPSAPEPLPALAPETTDAQAVRTAFASRRPLVVGLVLVILLAAFLAFPTVRMELAKLGSRPPPGIAGPARRAWRFWQELLDCCRRFGLESHPAWTAEEFAHVVGTAAPEQGSGVFRLLRVYHACRFGGADLSADDERASKELLHRLPAALQHWRSRRLAPAASTR